MLENVIPKRLTARMVRSYIDFDGHKATVSADDPSIQATLQSEGVAGLWALLDEKGYAYLADEVGMGKTRQAMGVIATQFLSKADSRIAIVCSSAALQRQWQTEWSNFLSNCYKLLDDRLLGTADAVQLQELRLHQNLREFAAALKEDDSRIHLLRYSSFSRPLSLDDTSPRDMLANYAKTVGVAVEHLHAAEREIADRFGKKPDGWADDMRHALADLYCERVATLLTDGRTGIGADGEGNPVAPLDLLVLDEAQYLRHIGNWQNRHLKRILHRNARKWLFLSATPLHSRAADIHSLDNYLSQQPVAAAMASAALEQGRQADDRPKWDVVQVLDTMMIRRTRTYADRNQQRYGKVEYRQYDRVRYSGTDDPFMAMTMALVQKRLVSALAGQNNKFRQGECASFESLSSSVGRIIGAARVKPLPASDHPEFEPAKDHPADPSKQAPDRNVIDELNRSFVQAMPKAAGHGLPHAKLHRTVNELFERSLKHGSIEKTLVFVRRLDTVEEIRDLLHVRFQHHLDERIDDWHVLLSSPERKLSSKPWRGSFWQATDGTTEQAEPEDKKTPDDVDEEDNATNVAATHNRAYREQQALAYFEALKRSETGGRNGKLVSFRSRLHSHTDLMGKPLRGFLHRRPEVVPGVPADGDDAAWELNRMRWRRFLCAVLGEQRVAAMEPDSWLLGDPALDTDDAFKLAALQLCILQSMRQTEFVVDLFILHTHLASTPNGDTELPEKLLWFLERSDDGLPPQLTQYLANQRARFRHWIEHFDLIVLKCFQSGTVSSWETVWRERIGEVFRPLAPVIGRSGRVHNRHAIAHFNLPTHPNILVCTDVLKEGVDMHLFCSRVVHYGVAWTSGDLEQRIGRVDRFGSLISRRIAAHGVPVWGAPPCLDVVFPYLDGTLDKHQVNRVIRDKIASDLRMDLGKRGDEIGEISIESLGADRVRPEQDRAPPSKDGVVFFPKEVSFVREGGNDLALPPGMVRKGLGDQVRARSATLGDEVQSLLPLPACGAVVVRRVVEKGHELLRHAFGSGQQSGPLWTEEFVMVRGGTTHPSLLDVLEAGGPHAVRQSPAPDFVFDPERNTCTWRGGPAPVLLETIGSEFWLLRCCVQADSADGAAGPSVAERNRHRKAGYLIEADGATWVGAVVQRSHGAELPALTYMAARVHRAANNLRQPGRAADENAYRARSAFPVGFNESWMDTMKQSDVVACGQMLSGVQAWFEEAFESVLLALYDEVGPGARPLDTEPMVLLPNGMLHLQTLGVERFRVQAGLDLAGVSTLPFEGPKMWWEIVATPHSRGSVPELPLSELDELPHAKPSCWDSALGEYCAAFTSTDDRRYRYAALYHRVQDWERSRKDVIAALEDVRTKMREFEKFQHKNIRDSLLNALQ